MPGFFDLEPLMVARLMAPVETIKGHVLSMADWVGAQESGLPKPSVRVTYHTLGINADASTTVVEQTWLTVIAVQNVKGIKSGTAARNDAMPFVDTVFDLLDHWRIGNGFKQLMPVTPPVRGSIYMGVLYVPLAWKTSFTRDNQNP
ncbi:MAG: phage tail terminator protein [Halothiobacillus sp.]